MADPLRHVHALAAEIGSRGAASAGEARAAHYIAEAAKHNTHQVWQEPFTSFTSPVLPWVLILSLLTAAGFTVWLSPQVAAVLAVLGAVCFAGQSLGWIQAGWFFPRRASQNVVAIVPATEAIRRRLVLVAHYDSRQASRGWQESGVARLAVSVAALSLPVLVYLAAVTPLGPWQWLCLGPTGVLAGALGALLRHYVSADYMPDSPVAAAAALDAVSRLGAAPLRCTEVWAVFTGCREPGMVGLVALLARHGALLREADFLVIDRADSDATAYTIAEGRFPFRLTDAGLQSLLHAESLQGLCLRQRTTQASLALDHGYRAVGLLVGAGQLDQAAGIIQRVAERLDREVCAVVEQEQT